MLTPFIHTDTTRLMISTENNVHTHEYLRENEDYQTKISKDQTFTPKQELSFRLYTYLYLPSSRYNHCTHAH